MSTTNQNPHAPAVKASSALPDHASHAVLVLPVFCDKELPSLATAEPFLDSTAIAQIETSLRAIGSTGAEGEVHRLTVDSLPVASIVTVGFGELRDQWPADVVRRLAGVAARSLDKVDAVITTLSVLNLGATVEGLLLGAYRFNDFRSDKTAPKEPGLRTITVLTAEPKQRVRKVVERSEAIALAVATARDLVNTPPSHLHPAEFAKRAKALGDSAGIEVEVLDEKALTKYGYGGVIGVGKGSSRAPRLVRLIHRGSTLAKRPKEAKTVALVGKGVTFDTGGISIKPAQNMHHMTSDMAGAAAVIATVALAANRRLPIDVIATVPMAENMPSSTAQRPGDVLTQYGGTTVEVLDTDAEGRLILADAIVRACEDNPDYLVETSTLTGAQLVALGERIPGVMGSGDFRDRVAKLSQQVGENGWPMPLPTELKDQLKSTVADFNNIGSSRWAGMLVAGVFLEQFIPNGMQWAHIDIAGPAYNTGEPWGYTGKGGTGVPTLTLFAILEDIASNG